ncbi:MAG: T9SS type A sorting domain-containing protein [Bacteroidia bacterium]
MKTKLLLYIAFLCSSVFCNAQTTFQKVFGTIKSENAYSVQQTMDGGYIVCGSIVVDSMNVDVYLIKTDVNGDTLWTKQYGGAETDFGEYAKQTADSGYIIVGITNSFDTSIYSDVYVIKTNSLGDTLWTKTYGGSGDELGQFIQQTTDGGYIIEGHTDTFGQHGDFYLIKTDATGDTLWTKNYGGPRHDHGYCVQQTNDGGYITVGHSLSFGVNGGFCALKTDANGDTLWTKGYGGNTNSFCYSVQQTTDNGYILAGYTDCFGAGGNDIWLVKTNSIGDTLWTKTYGGTGEDLCNCAKQTTDGGYIVVGSTSSFGFGSDDVYLIRLNSSGDTLWSKIFGGVGADNGYYVDQTSDGGFIISASTNSFGAGDYDFYLIKTDAAGNSSCHEMNAATEIKIPAPIIQNMSPAYSSTYSVVRNTQTHTSSGTSMVNACDYSGINALDQELSSEIILYPNPSSGTVILQSDKKMGIIQIYNCLGESVYKGKADNTYLQIDLGKLAPGMYFVQTQDSFIKLIKN